MEVRKGRGTSCAKRLWYPGVFKMLCSPKPQTLSAQLPMGSAQFLVMENNEPKLSFITKKACPSSLPPAPPLLCMQKSAAVRPSDFSSLSVPCIISASELQEISEKPFRDRL